MLEKRERAIVFTDNDANFRQHQRHGGAVQSIFGFREKLDSSFPFANSIRFQSEPGINLAKQRVSRCVTWIQRNRFLHCLAGLLK